MLQEKDLLIGETEYRIAQLSGTDGLSLLITLSKMSGGLLGGMNFGKKESVLDSDLGAMAASMLNNLDDEKTVILIKKIMHKSIISPRNFNFDVSFSGNFDELFFLFFEILKLNYGSAFERIKKKMGPLLEKAIPAKTNKRE